jgi:hypothetical protein
MDAVRMVWISAKLQNRPFDDGDRPTPSCRRCGGEIGINDVNPVCGKCELVAILRKSGPMGDNSG